MKTNLYGHITQRIIAALEAGTGAYRMPWHSSAGIGTPRNAITGRSYRGINMLLLWAEASRAGYASGEWATYRQWVERGAQVRKGEGSTLVLLWKQIERRGDDDVDGEDEPRSRLLARAFHVFNADQVEGYTPERAMLSDEARIAGAEAFFQAQPASVWHGSDTAFYDPRADIISMPSFASFRTPQAFSVLAHELTHWTAAKTRLDRDLSGRFGSEAYGRARRLIWTVCAARNIAVRSAMDAHGRQLSGWP